jgi:chromosome segregation ATPase
MANVVLQDINKLIKTLSDGRGSSTILVKELRRITKYLDPGYNMADAALQDINKLIKTLKGKATITEALKSQIDALEKAVRLATMDKDKTYKAHSEALEALADAEAALDEASRAKQDAIKALAAAKAENGRVVYFGRSSRG